MTVTFKDFNEELVVVPWNNGVKLSNIENEIHHYDHSPPELIPTVKNLFKLANCVFFVNQDTVIQNLNDFTLNHCGFNSKLDAVGHTVKKVAKPESVLFERNHDLKVMNSKRTIIADELYMRNDDLCFPTINIKTPWYGNDNEIMGVFGISFISNLSLLSSETMILTTKTGILSNISTIEKIQQLPGQQLEKVYFTKREIDCMKILVRGKTAKEIARILHLSPRTVENYLVNIKAKMNVSSKSELIEKILENGYLL